MQTIKYSLLTGVLISAVASAVSFASPKKNTATLNAAPISTLASRQNVWSTATSDTNFEWSAPLRTVNDFSIGWVGLSTQYYISEFTWKYKNNEKNIVDSMTFTKMYFATENESANLSGVTVSTIVDGEVKKQQTIHPTHLTDPYPRTHWLFDDVVSVTGLTSLVGNKQVTFKFKTSGSNARIGFVKDEYFTVSGYASTKVTLDNQGGSTNSSVYLVEGYPMSNVSVPTREDYEFDGYYSEIEGGGTKYYNADGTPALTSAGSASTLYAKWNRVGTNITLDKEGGTGGDDSTLGVLDQTLADVVVPTRPGYTFNGYYSEPNGQGTQYYNENGQSSFVWNSEDTSATFYASWTIKPEVQNAITKIDQIGTVTYSEDSFAKLNDAQSAYDAVEAADKAGVSNYSTLEAGWNTYNTQKQAGADTVKGLIDAIGTVTLEKESDIVAAREAYEALTAEQKALVTNYSTLEAAEERLAELKANKAAADVVVGKINAIGEVKYPNSFDAIKEARDAYDALTNAEQRGFVSNYATLTDAEVEYENQKTTGVNNAKALIDAIGTVTLEKENDIAAARTAYEALTEEQKTLVGEEYLSKLEAAEATYKSLDDNYKADQVDALITDIGTVEDTQACKDKIDAARDAYDALTADQKALVDNYSTLEAAEKAYNDLHSANTVEALINAVGEVTYTDECKAKIDAARTAYEALTSEQKDLVTNYSTLEAAEERLAELKANKAAADVVVGKINAIGEVKYPNSFDAIKEARDAYDALTNAEQRGFVSNYATLTAAEEEYENQKTNGVNNAKTLIDAIGTVTLEKENDIVAARTAYETLTEEQKTLVGEEYLSKLVAAEERLAELKANKAAADAVVGKINAIGEVKYPSSFDAIKEARDAYNALTNAEQRGFVSNYAILTDAEEEYENQKTSGVNNAKDLIDAIGTVEDTQACKDKIDAAREAYEALTSEQKALVTNYSTLEATEKAYSDLHSANTVEALINAVGKVAYTDECKTKIDAARTAYEALTAEQKALVENYATLEAAEKAYSDLHSINTVEALVNAVVKVAYTDECKAKIDAARTAYEALTTEQKASVKNYTTLTSAEEVYKHVDNVAKTIDNIGNVSLDSGDKIKTTTEAYNALTKEEQALIPNYHGALEEKTQTYDKLVSQHKTNITLAIVFGILGGLILIVCGAWALMMFVFNKWTKVDDKVLRAFKLFGLKNKDGKFLVLVFPMKFVRKEDAELFKNKEDALK